MPLSPPQVTTLARCTVRQLLWGQRQSSRELRGWRTRAEAIDDPTLRQAALTSLTTKRGHADGAALFSILAPPRRQVMTGLVAYQTIWDYLDSAHETAPDERNGRQLHLALVDALDVRRTPGDYYRHHPGGEHGYLDALVATCRAAVAPMPSYGAVLPALEPQLRTTVALPLTHVPGPGQPEATLRPWAAEHAVDGAPLAWFELGAAASASLVQLALVAVASVRGLDDATARAVAAAYWPWASLTATMLDSYVDQAEDAAAGGHSYVGHYASPEHAVERLEECVRRSAEAALAAPDGRRHAVIVACMIAMYLSKDSAWTPAMRPATLRLLRAGGTLTQALAPVLRAWRMYYGHRAA